MKQQDPQAPRVKPFWRRHYILSSLLVSILGSLVCGLFIELYPSFLHAPGFGFDTILNAVLGCLFFGAACGLTLGYAVVLTLIELCLLFWPKAKARPRTEERVFDGITLFLGPIYSIFYVTFYGHITWADWEETLANAEQHTPVYSGAGLTVFLIACVALLGYLVLTYVPLTRLPPLVIVFSIAAMYLGNVENAVWLVQIYEPYLAYLPMLLFPLNWLFITIRTLRTKMAEWNASERPMPEQRSFLQACNRLLDRAGLWPAAAFVLMWPLLGILICVLVLFGQAPNAVIKAWTETSDWNLSQRVAPQNIYYDEHYLCTVAAGGHRKVVKPQRLGVRHGHQVIVNRQLCVANAFEQVLEERTPRFHRSLRHFYDTYGFPIARKIRSPYLADLIYFLMKPPEWLFLFVLYCADAHPEDRIAIQYTGKRVRDLL